MRIAVLGAPGAGATELAQALQEAPQAKGHADLVVAAFDTLPSADERRRCALTLLTGLEQPSAADTALRAALHGAGVPYQVVYGDTEERLHAALRALEPLLPGVAAREEAPVRWTWNCDRCGDADCEHRLFKL